MQPVEPDEDPTVGLGPMADRRNVGERPVKSVMLRISECRTSHDFREGPISDIAFEMEKAASSVALAGAASGSVN